MLSTVPLQPSASASGPAGSVVMSSFGGTNRCSQCHGVGHNKRTCHTNTTCPIASTKLKRSLVDYAGVHSAHAPTSKRVKQQGGLSVLLGNVEVFALDADVGLKG